MTTTTGLQIVDARREHAPFIAWVILTAFRSHLPKGFWDFMRPGPDEEILCYLEALTTSEAKHWTQLPLFMVAEVNGEPAAALSGYFDEEYGEGRLRAGMEEADAKTGAAADVDSMAKGLTIMAVVPEHPAGTWIVESVATRPEFRRRGLVDALMEEIMERGRERGAKASDISVFIGNDSAQAAYQKAGYKVVGEKTDAAFEAVYGSAGIRTLRREL
jgi:ribosomal protein S18 acetylase RimI-like enzyme